MKKLFFILITLFLLESSALGESEFSDIKGHWAESTIEWAVSNNITKGYENGTFKPNKMVSEAEFASLLLRAFGQEISNPEGNSHWADGVYNKLNQLNYPNKGFKSIQERNQPIDRGRVAQIITSSQGMNFDINPSIRWLLINKLSKGKTSFTVGGYGAEDALTRAEAISFIKSLKDNYLVVLKPRPSVLTNPKPINDQYQELLKKDHPNILLQEKIKEAADGIQPPTGYTKEQFHNLSIQAYHLIKKTQIKNGKVRVYLPKPTRDNEFVIVNYYDRTNGDIKKYFMPWKEGIPEYYELPATNAFTIGVTLNKEGQSGYVPVVSGSYNSYRKYIKINTFVVEENVNF
ncbi:S-layer homology domain-containing protein [Robertmurraya sp.]|uniref:S-layer homology domain-containing protein n=1 Tax=Robertmurraya sp. TaxID=2837525 RepID=UPI003704ADD9